MNISVNEVVKKYGTHTDGISVYKNRAKIGYITDLRLAMARDISKNKKQKEYRNKVCEQRREAMPEAVIEMKEFLDNQLGKFEAEIFINITQPNVHLNGHKCYIVVDPIYNKHRLGILHKTMDSYDMIESLGSNYRFSECETRNHILINSIERDDIIEVIKKICCHL